MTDEDLTDTEREVSEHLTAAAVAFGKLSHRSDEAPRQFARGIDACQSLLAWRVLGRVSPDTARELRKWTAASIDG